MRISDWSSDVCSSDLFNAEQIDGIEAKYPTPAPIITATNPDERDAELDALFARISVTLKHFGSQPYYQPSGDHVVMPEFADFHTRDDYYSTLAHELCHYAARRIRSEEHTSELQSLMRISYAVFCLKNKKHLQ